MKRLLFLTAILALSAFGQTTVVPVSFTVANTAIADLFTWSHGQVLSLTPIPTLTAPMLISDLTATVSSTAGFPTSGTVMIGAEAITYTGLTATTLTGLTRGVQLTAAAAHPTISVVAVPVSVLKYPTMVAVLKALVMPGIQAAIGSLGANSAHVGALIAAQATADAAPASTIATAVQ